LSSSCIHATQIQVPVTPDTLLSSRMDAQMSGLCAYLFISYCTFENLMPLKKPDEKTRIFWTLLKVQSFSYFEHHLRRRLGLEDSEVPNNYIIELVITELHIYLK
jgi:hypothetical protein